MLQRLVIAISCLLLCVNFAWGGTPANYVGSNGNWNVPGAWSTNPVVPLNGGLTAYDVTISGNTVTYNISGSNTVQTLTLSSSAVLTLSNGDNLAVVDALSLTASTINAQGAAFSAGGSITLNGATLNASSGGSIAVPGLTSFGTNSHNGTIQVDGAASHVTVANLTTLALSGNGFTARAQNAGVLSLDALAAITSTGNIFEGTSFIATGTNSILLANAFTSLTMNGASITLQAQSGGYAEMSSLATVSNSGSIFGNFNAYANGAASKVNLPALTTLDFHGANDTFQATAGGDLEAPLLSTLTFYGSGFEKLNLQASGIGGRLYVPLLGNSPLSHLDVSVQTGGTLDWGHPTSLTASSLTLDTAGTIDTSSLTTITSTSFTATNGATLTIPATVFSTTSLGSATWQANNASSKLQLPNLTSITLSGNDLTLQAQNGGDLELPAVSSISTGTNSLHITASGSGSVVNIPAVPSSLNRLAVAVTDGSILWGTPTALTSSSVSITNSGTINLSALTNMNSTSFTVSGGASLTIPLVTTYATNGSDSATQTANDGSTLTFPALTTVSNPGGSIFGNFNVTASGTGAKVNLPALTTVNLLGQNDTIKAKAGGDVELPVLAHVTNTNGVFEQFNLQVSDAGSIINAPTLGNAPLSRCIISLNGGAILWANPTVLTASSVTIDTSGTIALAQLTTIDSTSFNAANGVTISLPNVTTISVVAGTSATLQATGSNSTLSLPAVTTITNPGDIFSSVTIAASGSGSKTLLPALKTVTTGGASATFQASSGGQVLATAITTATSTGSIFGNFNVSADGAGSKVFLQNLSVMHMATATNNLTATNGGDIELPALSTITATGSIFESFNVQSSGTGSLVNLSGLLSTASFPDALALANNGEIDLAGKHNPFSINFLADFDSSNSGTLDVYFNSTLLTRITPNNFGAYMPYSIFVGTAAPDAAVVRFIANGSGASVTLQDYSVPEPASLGILAVFACTILRRPKNRRK